uniref:Uncharacterized protein n=1 Tax=viral metagenome TaxID=1070528 RepID=A0A6C0AFR4_9ZZZZ
MEGFIIGENYKVKFDWIGDDSKEKVNFIGKLIGYIVKKETEHIFTFSSATYVSKNTYWKFEVLDDKNNNINGKYINILNKHRHKGAEGQIRDDFTEWGSDDDSDEFEIFSFLENLRIK